MPAYRFEGFVPVVHPEAFVHPDAVLVGDVVIERGCFIAPCTSLRGDMARITVGEGSNVQDGCVIHTFPGTDVVLEAEAHIGHLALLHGCRVCRGALVGSGAVILDGAVVGEEALVAAMAFVKGEMVIPPRMLAIGNPARISRPLRPEEIAWKVEGTRHYQQLARRFAATLCRVDPLAALEPDRGRLPDAGPAARPPR
ncbi:MAG: transferase hexapeptide repeat family protein [Planctomycetota bacterium]